MRTSCRSDSLRVRLLALCGLLVACEDQQATSLTADLGGFLVRVEVQPARLVVSNADGTPLLDGLPGGATAPDPQLPPHVAAAVRHADATYRFAEGSFKITEDAAAWRGVAAFDQLRREGDQVRFGLRDQQGVLLGEARIAPAGEGQLSLEFTAAPADANRFSFAFACAPDEHFLGFGGQSFDVDHRGQTVPIWVSEDGITKLETDDYASGDWFLTGRRHSTHTPMPLYLSSRGYALLLETPYRSVFAMCSEADTVARVEAWEPRLALRLFHDGTPAGTVERLTAHLGRPELPPAFAFAPWLDAIFGSDNVRRVAARLRAEDIPTSLIWTEDFRGGNDTGLGYVLDEDWTIDRALYPDFETLAQDLHGQGFKFLTYANTFLVSNGDVYDEALAAGYSIHTPDGDPYVFTGATFLDTSLVDLSNPAAVAWTKAKFGEMLTAGADGYMADFAEWLPADAVLASGESAVARHNLYPVDYQRLNRELFDAQEALDGVERLFFVRSAYLGSQSLVSVVWAGDQQTDFSTGDGLPSVIPIGIGLGIAGFPYFGHDIAGYQGTLSEPVTKELYLRWTCLGALSPVMRTHHGTHARQNWNWESDADTTAQFRRWAKLHQRLFPYLYAMAKEAADRGLPMLRPVALGYPAFEPGWTRTDQYLLGDRILVAPVVEEGVTSRAVALPPGTFYPLEGGPAVTVPDGGAPIEIAAPVGECPAFVPAGTILALYPEEVDTVLEVEAVDLVTAADIGDDREIWIWPGGDGTLVETGGLAYEWHGAELVGPANSATWNGTAAALAADGAITVTGPGVLVVTGTSGTATLTVTGGVQDRQLVVRVRGN